MRAARDSWQHVVLSPRGAFLGRHVPRAHFAMGACGSRAAVVPAARPQPPPPPTESPRSSSGGSAVYMRVEKGSQQEASSSPRPPPAALPAPPPAAMRPVMVPPLLLSRLSENHSVANFSATDMCAAEPEVTHVTDSDAASTQVVVAPDATAAAADGASDHGFTGLDDIQAPSSARTDGSSVDASSTAHSSFNALRVNQYVLGPILGVGGFGKVRRCLDTTTGEELAVKILRKSLLKKKRIGRFGNALQNVEREVAIWKKLDHPHIVRLVEALDDAQDHLYLVSELVAGGPCMTGNEPLSLAQIQVVAAQLLDALRYLHFQRVVHRDIKPGNLLVTSKAALATARRGKSNGGGRLDDLPHGDSHHNLYSVNSAYSVLARAETPSSIGGESLASRTTLVSSQPPVSVVAAGGVSGNSSVIGSSSSTNGGGGGWSLPSAAAAAGPGGAANRGEGWTRPAVLTMQPVLTRSRAGSFARYDDDVSGVSDTASLRLDSEAVSRAPSRQSTVAVGDDASGMPMMLDPEDEAVYPADADLDLFAPPPPQCRPSTSAPFDLVLKVTDFGVSQVAAEGEGGDKTRSTAGTAAFLAPEMVTVAPLAGSNPSPSPSSASPSTPSGDGMHSGFAADVWATGMTLYTLLHGAPAFSEPTLPALYDAIVHKPLPWPRDQELSGSADYCALKDLISRMLDRDPVTRITVDEALMHPWVTAITAAAGETCSVSGSSGESTPVRPAAAAGAGAAATTPDSPQASSDGDGSPKPAVPACDAEPRTPSAAPAGVASSERLSVRPVPSIRIHVSDEEVAQAISPVTSFRVAVKSASFAKKWAARARSFHASREREAGSSTGSIASTSTVGC